MPVGEPLRSSQEWTCVITIQLKSDLVFTSINVKKILASLITPFSQTQFWQDSIEKALLILAGLEIGHSGSRLADLSGPVERD